MKERQYSESPLTVVEYATASKGHAVIDDFVNSLKRRGAAARCPEPEPSPSDPAAKTEPSPSKDGSPHVTAAAGV